MNHLPHTFEQVTRRGALSRAASRTSAMLAVGLATAATITLAPTFGVNAGAQDGPAQENVALAFESPLEDVSPDVLKVTALATLGDERGWVRAGFTFTEDESSPNRILLAEPDATAALCAGADADGTIGCQRETIVVINAAAWRQPPDGWAEPETYRQYLINHLVGHLLGQAQQVDRCPNPGEPAAVMAPQFEGLEGCQPNAWPLDPEVLTASKRPVEIAQAPGTDDSPTATTSQDGTAVTLGTDVPKATGEPANTGTTKSSSPAALVALGVIALILLAGLAWIALRRRRPGASPDSLDGGTNPDGFSTATDLTETDPPDVIDESGTTPINVPATVEMATGDTGDDHFVPFGLGANGSDDDLAGDQPWTLSLSGAAQQEGRLAWLVPNRWEERDITALTDALSDTTDASSETTGDPTAPEQVGDLLTSFFQARPYLAPDDHEAVGLTILGTDEVVAVALGAAEVIELRNGLAKPARRQGAVRLHHSDTALLEVEVSVIAPARPRARIMIKQTGSE